MSDRDDIWLLVLAAVLSSWSPACSAARTPRSRRSRRPAPRRSAAEGGRRRRAAAGDRRGPAALPEHRAVPADALRDRRDRPGHRGDAGPASGALEPAAATVVAGAIASLAIMLVVSFVVIGVGPAHRRPPALRADRAASAGPVIAFTKVLGPLPRLLILVGNAITPGRGFSEGPFASEAELRELVDLAEASSVIESGERQMIHSVFELGDTMVREVMVPRTDVVFIERSKTLRQAMSLALRSGYSPDPGDRGEPRRHRRLRLPQGRHQAGLRPARGRDDRAGRVGDAPGALRARTPSRSTRCCARCRPSASTSRWSSTSTAAPPAWSPSRTCWRRSSGRSPTSTTRPGSRSSTLARRRRPGQLALPGRRPRGDLSGSPSTTTTSTPSAG